MNYEKKYKEALEKLRSLHNDYDTVSTLIDIKEELENIFPELKESEDEKIRKEIISALKNANYEGVYDKHLAWLEKQETQKSILDELEMTLSVSEDAYLRSNLEKLIKEFKEEQ